MKFLDFDDLFLWAFNSLAFCTSSLEILGMVMMKMRTSWRGAALLFAFGFVVLVHFIVIGYHKLLQFVIVILVFFRKISIFQSSYVVGKCKFFE